MAKGRDRKAGDEISKMYSWEGWVEAAVVSGRTRGLDEVTSTEVK